MVAVDSACVCGAPADRLAPRSLRAFGPDERKSNPLMPLSHLNLLNRRRWRRWEEECCCTLIAAAFFARPANLHARTHARTHARAGKSGRVMLLPTCPCTILAIKVLRGRIPVFLYQLIGGFFCCFLWKKRCVFIMQHLGASPLLHAPLKSAARINSRLI